jgi:protein tyrosine phosphatase
MFAGPLDHVLPSGETVNTIGNFWHMIWDLNCERIAMLTNLIEGNKVEIRTVMVEIVQRSDIALINSFKLFCLSVYVTAVTAVYIFIG